MPHSARELRIPELVQLGAQGSNDELFADRSDKSALCIVEATPQSEKELFASSGIRDQFLELGRRLLVRPLCSLTLMGVPLMRDREVLVT